MTDHFAALQQPRRPWLDAEAVKEAFHRATARYHPDVTGGDATRFAALNAAHTALREPASRLRHLLELEAPEVLATARNIPAQLAELFMQIGAQHHALEAFLKKEAQAATPLAKALLQTEKLPLLGKVQGLLALAEAQQAQLLDDLRSLDERWDMEKPTAPLAEIYQALAFLTKWREKLRDDVFHLGA